MVLVVILASAALSAFVTAWWVTGLVRRWARQGRLMDVPNARSAHVFPTPRGGGVGIVAAFILASAALGILGWVPGRALAVLLGGGMAVAGIGLMDDLGHVAIRWRLLVQIGAVVLGLGLLSPPAGTFQLADWLVAGGVAVLWLWMINLYNFMDGIDGLAAMEAVTVALGSTVILFAANEVALAAWIGALAAACGGFLVWNRPPARIFMGDVGSSFLGFAFGGLALISGQAGVLNPWSWAILLAVFIVDASVTLLRRMLRGERWWRAHSSHAYQRLARRHGHLAVTITTAFINLLWLLPWAWLAAQQEQWGWLWLSLAYAPLICIVLYARAGVPEQR